MPHLISFFKKKYQVDFQKGKTAKGFHFMLSILSRGGFRQTFANVVKKFLTLISNDPGFKLFTLIPGIDEVNC